MRYPFRNILFFLFLCGNSLVYSQDVVFNKVKSPDGNAFTFVSGITQDIYGNMWFSTKIGLVRYDGNKVTTFKNNPLNHSSLISNNIETVFADSDGTIWIGSLGEGLDHFDPVTGIFTHYDHDKRIRQSLGNDTVTVILRDKHGTIWIGTHGGLDRFDPQTNTFSHYRHNASDPRSLSNNQVRVMYEDRQGTLWIGTGSPYADNGGGPDDGGLNRMDKNSGNFTRFLHDSLKSNSLVSNKVSAMFEDSKGVFWVGTAKNGLHKMDRMQGTFERIIYDPAHPEKLSGPSVSANSPLWEHVSFITQDFTGSYWIGSSNNGLNYYNPSIGKTVHYNGISNPETGFTDYGVWKAFTSRDGILWLGCPDPGGNIYRINPVRKQIPHFLTSSGYVTSFLQQPDGRLLIGTDHELLYNDKEFVKRYLYSLNLVKTNDIAISSIMEDSEGNIWIGGVSGLTEWNKKTNKFYTYKHEPGNPNSLSNTHAFTVREELADKLWIGTFRGLNLLDRKTGAFTRYFSYPEDTNAFGKNMVSSICRDKSGKLWISAWSGGGVNLLNQENGQFKNYLKGVSIVRVYEDTDGILWVSAERGLYKYDKGSDNFIKFNDPMSLTEIPYIFSMVEDSQGNLWLATSDGFLRINRKRNEIRLFGKNYGVGSTGMAYGGSYRAGDGKLYFGDATGYFLFDPAVLVENLRPPEIVITGFNLADQAIKTGIGSPLKENLLQAKEILLHYNQNIFSFDLNVIDYADPEQNRLFYFLDNYETDWHQANSDRKAYYFNIAPGKYVFHIKAVNSSGAWAEKTIRVVILPPWWKTWWAYSFYALFLIAAVFGFVRFMRRRIMLAERKRTQERELAHAKEIEKAYTELKNTQAQLIQSEKMASLGELTAGIAHEIQNPLNFVNNFSEVNTELIEELKQEIEKGNMDEVKSIAHDIAENELKITQHGKRADAVVKGMLLHSRSSSGIKEPTDINAIADEYLRLAYHGLRAKDKSFNATMKTDFDDTVGKINVIPQDIGRVILNLITNAFYSVTEKKHMNIPGYEPTVSVSTSRSHSKSENTASLLPGEKVTEGSTRSGEGRSEVRIKVKDNGNGIPQKVLDKIYQPFFTTKPTGQGTGLGLSMSYEIITKAHGGQLKVETVEGEGAEFTIILPA